MYIREQLIWYLYMKHGATRLLGIVPGKKKKKKPRGRGTYIEYIVLRPPSWGKSNWRGLVGLIGPKDDLNPVQM